MKVAVCDYRAGNIRSVEIALRRLGAEFVDDLCAEPAQCDLDRADVPRAVVTDTHLHSTPFVEGIPADSARTAIRSARPTALYAASAV